VAVERPLKVAGYLTEPVRTTRVMCLNLGPIRAEGQA